jgi:hypothetical protein
MGNRRYSNDEWNTVTTGYPVDAGQARRRQKSPIRHEMILSDEVFGFRHVSSSAVTSEGRSVQALIPGFLRSSFPGVIAAMAATSLSEKRDQCRNQTDHGSHPV